MSGIFLEALLQLREEQVSKYRHAAMQFHAQSMTKDT